MTNTKKIDPTVVSRLKEMFDRENGLVKIFCAVGDRFAIKDHILVKLRLVANHATDGRDKHSF